MKNSFKILVKLSFIVFEFYNMNLKSLTKNIKDFDCFDLKLDDSFFINYFE